MADGDLVRELSQDIDFLRASPEEQRQYLAFKDPDYASKSPDEQETRRQQMHNQAVQARNAQPTQFERERGAGPQKGRGVLANLAEAAIPQGSPVAIPGYSHVKAAYETGMAGVRGMQAARARGEPWYRQAASAFAPIIGLNEEQERRAAERGDVGGVIGGALPAAALATLPLISEARVGRGARRPVGEMPRTGMEDLRPLPGPLEGPRAPTATETLDAATEKRFPGRKFGELDHADQMEVMRGGAGGGPPEPTTIPTVPRGTPPRPGAPGGGRPPLTGERLRDVANIVEGAFNEPAAGGPEPLFRIGEQMGLRVAKAPGLADVYIPKGMSDAEIPGFVAQQHALERQMKPGLPGQPRQPGSTLTPTPAATPSPGAPGLTPAPPGATLTPAHGTRPAAPQIADLLRGWGGAEEGTLPPVRPEEPPPKK